MSDGDIGQYEHDPALYLCYAKNGCEGRGEDAENPTRALKNLGMVRDGGLCPTNMRRGTRIYTYNGANGDFNQGMSSGGDVHMCEER